MPIESLIAALHQKFIYERRLFVLSRLLAALVPIRSKVLDVGSGDGALMVALKQQRPDLQHCITGLETHIRPGNQIEIQAFDGMSIPYDTSSVPTVLLIDVLHHAADPHRLLSEATRVASDHVIIKDHFKEGYFAQGTLRFMDHTGNARHGVALPYAYWTRDEWKAAWNTHGLQIDKELTTLGLYPIPLKWWFERSLHFMTRLSVNDDP